MSEKLKVQTITENIVLQVITCRGCGVVFALPKTMYDTCREKGGFWHCPNGHS